MEIETRSFQMQMNLSQMVVQQAIHHAQVQDEEPLQLKYSSPPTIIIHISLYTGPVSALCMLSHRSRTTNSVCPRHYQ
jgi:hypothetical protein